MNLTPIQPEEKSLDKPSENSIPSLPELALSDYATFYGKILGYDQDGYGVPEHQERWCDFLQDNNLAFIFAPACHGKSTVLLGMPIWTLARERGKRCAIVTGTDDLAEGILAEIKGHLESNPMLNGVYGQFKSQKSEKWTKYEVRVDGAGTGTIRKRDASITVGGPMSNWKGKRFDEIYLDDLVNEKNSDTITKAQSIIKWVWETLHTRLEPWGKIRGVGTFETEYDFYQSLIQNNRGFKILHEKAIVDEMDRKVLWPEKWTYKLLCERRELDQVAFMKHYQNTLINADTRKLTQDQIDACYDSSRTMYGSNIPENVRQKYSFIYTAVDPAWTKGRRSKYSVITTIGLTKEGDRREILDITRAQWNYDELFDNIRHKYYALLPGLVIVESNQMQDELQKKVASSGIPSIPFFTSDRKNHTDTGIPMVFSTISTGKLSLPTGDEISRSLSQQFMSELLSWPSGVFSDILMTVYFVEATIRQRWNAAVGSRRSTILPDRKQRSPFRRSYGSWQ